MSNQVRLQNKIGRTSLVGQIVKLAPNSTRAYVLADISDPDAIGTCADSVPNNYWGLVNLLNTVNYNDVIATVRTITNSTTETVIDYCIVCDSPSPIYIYLLNATGSGRRREILNIGIGTVTIVPSGDPSDPSSQDFIDGATSITINQWDVLIIKDLTTGLWKILQSSWHAGIVTLGDTPPNNPGMNDIWVDTG